jgi:hypothetical protein
MVRRVEILVVMSVEIVEMVEDNVEIVGMIESV